MDYYDYVDIDYYKSRLEMVKIGKQLDKELLGLLSIYFDLEAMEKECKKNLERAKRNAKRKK